MSYFFCNLVKFEVQNWEEKCRIYSSQLWLWNRKMKPVTKDANKGQPVLRDTNEGENIVVFAFVHP